MAKKSSVERNNKRKRLAAKYASKRAALLQVANDTSLSNEDRFKARLKLAELPRNSHRRACATGAGYRASAGYYRKLNMSRISLRDLASKGLIPGMVKSSW